MVKISVIVNDVGYANSAAIEDMSITDFRTQIDANLHGVVYAAIAALAFLRQ